MNRELLQLVIRQSLSKDRAYSRRGLDTGDPWWIWHDPAQDAPRYRSYPTPAEKWHTLITYSKGY